MAGSIKLTGKIADKAVKMLKKVSAVLEKNNIPYVLEAGTLLGIVRENRLLPWDNDMDITITEQYGEKLLGVRWQLWLAGYRTRVRRYKKDTGPFTKGTLRILKIQTTRFFFFKEHSLLDIFIKKPIDGDYYWTVSTKSPVLKSVPKKYYDEHTQIEFEGKKFMAPKEYEGFLEYCYGDWRTPVKDWNFRTGDNCVREIYQDE
ncbi:MAG: LicD family protein [Calditrichae bacterium]|nr:LicD family protein [Calditrichia bacterium]